MGSQQTVVYSLTGPQEAVFMTTCSSMTCPMLRPYLRLTFFIKTQIPSLLWPKSYIQETTSLIWRTILYVCYTRRVNYSGCILRTLMGWKDVCIYIFKITRHCDCADSHSYFCVYFYQVAGIPPEMLVEAHGTFATATCTICLRKYEGDDLRVRFILLFRVWNVVFGSSEISLN